MTDKELRKLSRLELLELLLEASKENEKLKAEIELLKTENKTAYNIENLSEVTRQMENALKYANDLTDNLKGTSAESASAEGRARPEQGASSDREIYKRILSFFARNDDKLDVLPSDIANDVRARIRSLLERKSTNI